MMRTWTQARSRGRPRGWAAIAGGGLATMLALAGCSADDPDSPPPPSSSAKASASASSSEPPSPSPSASSVVVKPERPAEMDDDGAAGAEAAAQYFLQLRPYIMQTNDTAEWEAMSHQACAPCAQGLEQASRIAQRDDTWEGGATQTRLLHAYEQDSATGLWPMDIEVNEAAATVTDSAGNTVYEQDPRVSTARVEVGRRDGRWVVVNVAQPPEQ